MPSPTKASRADLLSDAGIHALYFVRRQQAGVQFVHAELAGHLVGHVGTIACQHDHLLYALAFQPGDGCGRLRFDRIGDDDVSGVAAVRCQMDDGPFAFARFRNHAGTVHQFLVSGIYFVSVYLCPDAFSGKVFHIRYP